MGDFVGIIGFIAFAAIAVGAIVFAVIMEKKRTKAWEEIAGRLGFEFLGQNNNFVARCSRFKLFSTGNSRKSFNVISGESGGIGISVFDYNYTTGSGKNRTTHRYTVCMGETSALDMPHCYLRPQHFFDSLGKLFGGQDIDFDEDPEFSKKFVLQGENEADVRQAFDSKVRQWFVNNASKSLHFEARGDHFVFHYGKRMKPEEVEDIISNCFELLNALS